MSSLSLKNRFLSVKLQTYTDFFNSMPADACCGNIQPPSDWHTRTLCITMCVGRVLTVNTECECTATLTLSYTHTHIQTFCNEHFLSFLRPNFQLYVQVFRIWKKTWFPPSDGEKGQFSFINWYLKSEQWDKVTAWFKFGSWRIFWGERGEKKSHLFLQKRKKWVSF